MGHIATTVATVAALLLVVGGMAASAGPGGETIRTVSHVLDLGSIDADGSGEVGDSVADTFTSVNEMRDGSDELIVGRDLFTCTMADVEAGMWECSGTTTFEDAGAITYQGAFDATGKSVMAITGGTGDYKGARGWVVYKPLPGDDFPYEGSYHLLP
jgi:hypothetical protein